MTIVNPSPQMALSPALAQPQILMPRSAHVRTKLASAVRTKANITRVPPHTPQPHPEHHPEHYDIRA